MDWTRLAFWKIVAGNEFPRDLHYPEHVVGGYVDGDHSPHHGHWRSVLGREGMDLSVLLVSYH